MRLSGRRGGKSKESGREQMPWAPVPKTGAEILLVRILPHLHFVIASIIILVLENPAYLLHLSKTGRDQHDITARHSSL